MRAQARFPNLHRQRGVTALVALIFLTLLALMSLSAYRISGQHVALVGNAQSRAQAMGAANYAIEQMLSSAAFAQTPEVYDNFKMTVDMNGDGQEESTVTTARPACYRVRPVKTAELDYSKPADRSCLGSSSSGGSTLVLGGIGGALSNSDESQCSDTEWHLTASVNDSITGASVAVNQGAAMRVDVADAAKSCL